VDWIKLAQDGVQLWDLWTRLWTSRFHKSKRFCDQLSNYQLLETSLYLGGVHLISFPSPRRLTWNNNEFAATKVRVFDVTEIREQIYYNSQDFVQVELMETQITATTRISQLVMWVTKDWTIGVRFPAGTSIFPFVTASKTGPGAHPAPYPMSTVGKASGAWSWLLTSICCRG
jgi:hypothetical protein